MFSGGIERDQWYKMDLLRLYDICKELQGGMKRNPDGIYLFKVSNGNTKAMCEICLKITRKTPERSQ